MNTITKSILFLMIILFWRCGQTSSEKNNDESNAANPADNKGNEALYNEVMKIHDEVMPKMDDLYKLKEQLKSKLSSTPQMVEDKKREIESSINKLDSASEGMMIWMREFNPLPDSLDEEKARAYLENEMERVKKVRDDIYQAMDKATADI